ncbi:ribosomal protein l5 domain-containing protein [Sarocladium implicatum]|nr:ribosomal protein l5 domain-containing protein [Sarocladium implicatum]
MSGARDGLRLANAFRSARPLQQRSAQLCRHRFASTAAAESSTPKDDLADLEPASSFATPGPDEKTAKSFNPKAHADARTKQLPGSRYQYHPPKYYRGPLHPVQMPRSSDPIARDFVPGPFNVPRGKYTYESTVAPDLMTLTYKHKPPGYEAPESQKGELRAWDGSSPYHENRPRRGPRGGGSSRLGLLERDISNSNIPEIEGISIAAFAPLAADNKEHLQVARAVVQAISGVHPETIRAKKNVIQWRIRQGDFAGAKASLTGDAAYEFFDKLVTLVLPKIKDWPGMKWTTGDGSGNLGLGMEPEWMAFFPELEFNYDMYPPQLVPGCHINIKTSATSDKQGRLLMEALGMPFYMPEKKRR